MPPLRNINNYSQVVPHTLWGLINPQAVRFAHQHPACYPLCHRLALGTHMVEVTSSGLVLRHRHRSNNIIINNNKAMDR